MAERFRTIVRIIGSELDKSKVSALNKAITVLDNAGGKIHNTLNNAQNTLSSKYEVFAKEISEGTTIFQDLTTKSVENPAEKRERATGIVKWWQWYQRLIGMDRLELCKQQVDFAQDRLFNCQSERRHLSRGVTIQNEKLKEVYAELLQTKRDDPRYVQLTILENKSLQDLGKVVGKLNLLEKEERDHFTLLATAIKEYHVTQDMCAQRYKYISIVASVLLAIMSLVASMIYNNQRLESARSMLSTALNENKFVLATAIRYMDERTNTQISQVLKKLDEGEEKVDAPIPDGYKAYVTIGMGILFFFCLKTVLG